MSRRHNNINDDWEQFESKSQSAIKKYNDLTKQQAVVDYQFNHQLLEPDKSLRNALDILNELSNSFQDTLTQLITIGANGLKRLNDNMTDEIQKVNNNISEQLDGIFEAQQQAATESATIANDTYKLLRKLYKLQKDQTQQQSSTEDLPTIARHIINNAKTKDGTAIKGRGITQATVIAILEEYNKLTNS